MSIAQEPLAPDGIGRLRHDLLNPLNVLVGATNALLGGELDDMQRTWVRVLQSSTERLLEVVNRLETYGTATNEDGQARLADLCSIAAARIGKPFDRERLLETVRRVVQRSSPRVLLVDDSPELAMLVRSYVRGSDWDLDVVETGERAVAQATTKQYDVVLMDIDLPGLDGAAAAHAIRAADLARGASPTPIVAMTAFDASSSAGSQREPASAPETRAREVDPEISALIPEFLDNRRADVAMYRQALQAGEFGRIRFAAHQMKGTGRSYGFTEISRIGAELEVAAHANDAAAVSRLVQELDDFLGSVQGS